MDSQGVAILVWTHWIHTGSREEKYILLASHSHGRWSAPVRIARGEARAALALDAAGRADVLTSGYASALGERLARDQLLLTLRSLGGSLRGPLSLPVRFDDSGDPAPVMALDGSGGATVAWVDPSGSGERVAVLELDRNGRIVRPEQLMSPARHWPRGCSIGAIRLGVNQRGDAIVAWEQQAPESSRVVCGSAEVAVRRAGGRFGRSFPLAGTDGAADSPSVAIDGGGTTTALYEDDVGGRSEIDERRHAAEGGWTSPRRVSPLAATTAAGPRVALGARGELMALWEEFLPAGATEGQYVAVQASFSGDGSTWTVPNQPSPTGMDCREPELATTPGGSATAIWRNEGKTRLDAHGEMVDEPTRVEAADYPS
jgi:hypothetical protein